MTTEIRSPVVAMVGHVDHGKSSILDKIRGTAIVKTEAGGITQAISSTLVPINAVKKVCGTLLTTLKLDIRLPGLLFLDTPGHAAFNNLRKRGGNLADIAVLVIDINEGIKEQTIEAINILKNYKTPFLIAANKIDLVPGYRHHDTKLVDNLKKQTELTKKILDEKIYTLVGKLYNLGFESERFDRVQDYRKQLAIIPLSAKTGDGIPELLMMITGLAQRYLEESLRINVSGPGKGVILEVKEEKGLGTTLDVILYDGKIKIEDTIVIGGIDQPVVTKVKALFQPEPLADIKKAKFKPVNECAAAIGVKISATDLEDVVAGMPLMVANQDVELAKKVVQQEVEEVLIDVDGYGVVVKADSLGSLEALIGLLRQKGITVRSGGIGDITKKDIMDASAEKNPLHRVILAFNIKSTHTEDVKVISNNVIYRIIEELDKWQEEEKIRIEASELEGIIRPCKITILLGHIFRQSNPAVVGVEVVEGILTRCDIINDNGDKVGSIKDMQLDGKTIQKAKRGERVAVSITGAIVGRHIDEGSVLYSDITEEACRKLRKLKKYLNTSEIAALKEIIAIKRKSNTMWGI